LNLFINYYPDEIPEHTPTTQKAVENPVRAKASLLATRKLVIKDDLDQKVD
jgi:hypothetical protein